MTDEPTRDERGDAGLSTRECAIEYEIAGEETPSEAVVRAVASLTNTPVLDLDPLFEVVDPAGIDDLVGRGHGGEPGTERSITFAWNGCRVTVTGGLVRVRELSRDDP